MAVASGTSMAMSAGVRKMPLPMTFDTMIAAASNVPSRRSRVGAPGTAPGWEATLFGEQLPRDRELAGLHPRGGAVLGEDLHLEIDELLVLQHGQARLRARVAGLRADDHRRGRRAGREPIAADAPDKRRGPLVGVHDALEDQIELGAADRRVCGVLQAEADARHQLVLALGRHTAVEPAGRD